PGWALSTSESLAGGVGKEVGQAARESFSPFQKSQFVQFADVFPLKEFGYKPEPGQYLQVVGWIEVVAGALLAFGPQLLQEISNFVLTIVMIGRCQPLGSWVESASGGCTPSPPPRESRLSLRDLPRLLIITVQAQPMELFLFCHLNSPPSP
uniref:Transmembrane protein 35B n=1 Tax=Chelydra serpentina TaxID=8475 RepID=A0A8C3T505_CHESE